MKNERKEQLVERLIDSLDKEGLDHKEKRRILQSACNKMKKAVKAGISGLPEEEIEVEKSDSNCPKKNETIEFED